jgi:beta-galactosidase
MLGVCYYPEQWPESWWKQDAARMHALGIQYIRIGEFAWSKLEPKRGHFEFGWLDRAMDVLADAGLKIVLGTPTATPPKWLMDEHPDIAPVDSDGKPRGFGSRRHYSFSSEVYWHESALIVEKVAARYGQHKGLVGWQTDNEYGCHNTILSWGPEDLKGFKNWLRRRYQSTDQLNEAWGNIFWSMELTDFEQITLPNLTVTEANPAARLDFWRYQSSQVAGYDKMQCDIIRKHSPGRFITHNFMGFFNEFDHWEVGDNLDLASWDSYPIGFAEQFLATEQEKARWSETSHPDIAPYHHDLYRAVGHGRFWVMEQQPGPVNWAPWNPIPAPGMVRLWTWEALAHGADVVSYFRWRQSVSAQEQMHAGLNLPGLHELSPGGLEAKRCADELPAVGPLPETRQADVAIVYDYEAHWYMHIQPQGQDFRYYELVFNWYEAVRRSGLDVDFVRPGASLAGYKLVLVPSLPHVSEASYEAFAAAEGIVVFGPRTGSKTRNFSIPANLPPGPLAGLLDMRVIEVSSIRKSIKKAVTGAVSGHAIKWMEHIEPASATVLARFENDQPALINARSNYYLACWPDQALLNATIHLVCDRAGLSRVDLPEHIRFRRRGDLVFAFNYGPDAFKLDANNAYVLGEANISAGGVSIWRVNSVT